MATEPRKIIVVRKKKVHGGGHHGGSWKVAYADFVTAMMAFFLVMWILGMDEDARNAVEGYFANPIGYKKGYASGDSPISVGSGAGQVLSAPVRTVMRAREQESFEFTGNQIRRRLRGEASLSGLSVDVEVVITEAGLRIELVEDPDQQTFFMRGSGDLQPVAQTVLRLIGEELMALDNPLVLEGHTDAALFSGGDYTNWELSTDRANAARRQLERAGVDVSRFREVRGYGANYPRVPNDPLHPANRRISILLPFISAPAEPSPTSGSAAETGGGEFELGVS